LDEAQVIFDNYHNLLYPGVTKYREEYVLPQATKHGWIHLNWGLKLYTDSAKKDIRTLNNSTMQSYSNLTQIAAVEFDKMYKGSILAEQIKLVNIVHDCLYYEVTNDLGVIKYINDFLPPIMCTQFINDQALQIKAEIDIGPSLAHMVTLPNHADIDTISTKLATLKD
jgi:DNA polymerase I-like protein with 3'-5' exonuclease and polymerase domains